MLEIIIPMRVSICITTFLVLFHLCTTIFAAQIHSPTACGTGNDQHKHASTTSEFWGERENNMMEKATGNGKGEEKVGSNKSGSRRTLEIAAGSRLPNCLHACGSCSPCRLVMVSLTCASQTDEAESCPISYRCICNTKSYPVP